MYYDDEFGYKLQDSINRKVIRNKDVVFFKDQTIVGIDKSMNLILLLSLEYTQVQYFLIQLLMVIGEMFMKMMAIVIMMLKKTIMMMMMIIIIIMMLKLPQ